MPRVTYDDQKRNAAVAAVEFIEDKMILGLGTGTTTKYALSLLAEKVKEGLRVTGVPSSVATAQIAKRLKIPLVENPADFTRVDLTIDGADEVDPAFNLIKGGGGALTREKILATRSDRVIIIVDESKLVRQLGRFPVPVEALSFGWRSTADLLRKLGARVAQRHRDGEAVRTDNGNVILDCFFREIPNSAKLAEQIKSIVGVVEMGLFIGIADLVVVGKSDGSVEERWAT